MRANYVHYGSLQFRILSDKQLEELPFAMLQIMERTGVLFECQETLDLFGDDGADVSNPKRVKNPFHLVDQALRVAPKIITLYSRKGDPAIVLDGMTGSHFGLLPDPRKMWDPYTGKIRDTYVADIADYSRLIDALLNIERYQ